MEKTFVINLIVCRLAMLVDIESFLFNAFRNTQAMYLVQHFKNNEAHACRPHSYYGRAEELCQQEAASAAIEQPLFCSKSPVRIVPRQPQTPCTDDAPTGSSIFSTWSIKSTANIITTPQMAPISTDPKGDTRSHPAVMPTSPASTPFSVRDKEGLPYFIQLATSAKKPPAQAARLVVRNTCEMVVWSPLVAAANCEPG